MQTGEKQVEEEQCVPDQWVEESTTKREEWQREDNSKSGLDFFKNTSAQEMETRSLKRRLSDPSENVSKKEKSFL